MLPPLERLERAKELERDGLVIDGRDPRVGPICAVAESEYQLRRHSRVESRNGAKFAADVIKAFKHDGLALVELAVHRQELSIPPTIKVEQVTGFGVFMLKAVISGRGDQLVDLAKVNLFR